MKTKLPIIPFVSPPEWQYARLKDWLFDRRLDETLRKIPLPAQPEPVSDMPVKMDQGLVRPYDSRSPRVGEIRLLSSRVVPGSDRPLYLAVLSVWGKGMFLAAPFSPYAAPATPGEWLTGRTAGPLLVLSLWNARVIGRETLGQSWIAASLRAGEVKDALSVFRHATTGEALPARLVKQVGPPILVPHDPRSTYQQEQATLLASLAVQTITQEVSVADALRASVIALWEKVSGYCRRVGEELTWQPVPELARVHLKGAGLKPKVPVVRVGIDGRRRVVARVEVGVPLPSVHACWRLSPARTSLAGRRFAVVAGDSTRIFASGVISKSGGRFDIDAQAGVKAPTEPVVILLME